MTLLARRPVERQKDLTGQARDVAELATTCITHIVDVKDRDPCNGYLNVRPGFDLQQFQATRFQPHESSEFIAGQE